MRRMMLGLMLIAVSASPVRAETPLTVFSGDKEGITLAFVTTGPWRIEWSCVPAGTVGIWSYPVTKDIQKARPDDDMVEARGTSSSGFESGSARHPKRGTYYLRVNATCSWEIRVFADPHK